MHDLAGVAAKLEGRGGGGAVRARQGPRGAGVHRALLVARAAGGSAGAAGEGAAGLRLGLHQGVAAEADAAGRGRRRPGARGHAEPGRSSQAADPDPCAEGRRALLRCRGGDRQGPRDRRAQRLDPALHGGRQGPDEHQHRRRAPPRDLSRQGGEEGRGAAVHAQRRGRARASTSPPRRRPRPRRSTPTSSASRARSRARRWSWCRAPSPTSR